MVTVARILLAPIKDHQRLTVALLLLRPGRLKRRREPSDDAFLDLPWLVDVVLALAPRSISTTASLFYINTRP